MIDSVIVHNSVYSLGQIFSRSNYRESVVGRIGTKGRRKVNLGLPWSRTTLSHWAESEIGDHLASSRAHLPPGMIGQGRRRLAAPMIQLRLRGEPAGTKEMRLNRAQSADSLVQINTAFYKDLHFSVAQHFTKIFQIIFIFNANIKCRDTLRFTTDFRQIKVI